MHLKRRTLTVGTPELGPVILETPIPPIQTFRKGKVERTVAWRYLCCFQKTMHNDLIGELSYGGGRGQVSLGERISK